MGSVLAEIIQKVLKAHPYVFVFMIAVTGASLMHSYSIFAEQVDVDKEITGIQTELNKLNSKIDNVEQKVDRRFLQGQLENIKREIYVLEGIPTSELNNRDRDRLIELRLSEISKCSELREVGGTDCD